MSLKQLCINAVIEQKTPEWKLHLLPQDIRDDLKKEMLKRECETINQFNFRKGIYIMSFQFAHSLYPDRIIAAQQTIKTIMNGYDYSLFPSFMIWDTHIRGTIGLWSILHDSDYIGLLKEWFRVFVDETSDN